MISIAEGQTGKLFLKESKGLEVYKTFNNKTNKTTKTKVALCVILSFL